MGLARGVLSTPGAAWGCVTSGRTWRGMGSSVSGDLGKTPRGLTHAPGLHGDVTPERTAPSTVRNGLWNAGANALIAVAGLFSSVVVVRSLSPEAYGVMSYYLWLASVTGALGTLALPHALTKVAAELLGQNREPDAEALTALVWRVTLLLNGVILLLLTAVWLGQGRNPYLLMVAATQLPLALASIVSSHLWARQDYRPVALWTGAAALVQVALVVLAHTFGWAGPGFAAAVLGSGAVTWLGLLGHLGRIPGSRGGRVLRPVLGQYAAFLLPATLSRLIEVVVWQRSELFFLSRFSGETQIGFYNLAYTIYSIALAVGWALINGYYPAISHHHGARQPQAIRRQVQQGVTLAVLYAAPVSFGAVVLLNGVVRLLYGDKMLPAVAVGQVLLLGLTPGVLCGMLTLTLSAVGRVWLGVTLGLLVALVNLWLALWLIPRQGALGAAVATTAAQFVYFLGLSWVVSRVCGLRIAWAPPTRLLLLASATTLALPLLLLHLLPGPDLLKLLLATLVSGACYLALLWRGGELRLLQTQGGPS